MLIEVKYCGGCNPRYDRKAVLKRLRCDFPDLEIRERPSGAVPDFALALSGCPVGCADQQAFNGRLGKMTMETQDDYDALASRLRELGA